MKKSEKRFYYQMELNKAVLNLPDELSTMGFSISKIKSGFIERKIEIIKCIPIEYPEVLA